MREAEYVLNALPFDEMLKYFQGKIPISAEMYYAMLKEARERAFTVSNIESMKALEDIQRSLGMAMEKGWTLNTWKASMADLLDAWDIEGWHANTIYWTNMQTAYQIGRYEQMTDPDLEEMFPYWQYVAVMDDATRPEHAAMNGQVFRKDDPIWDVWYPPNGFNCRCTVYSLSEGDSVRYKLQPQNGSQWLGKTINTESGPIKIYPDKGWDYNPGKVGLLGSLLNMMEAAKWGIPSFASRS